MQENGYLNYSNWILRQAAREISVLVLGTSHV